MSGSSEKELGEKRRNSSGDAGNSRKQFKNISISGSAHKVQVGDIYYPSTQRELDASVPRGQRDELLLQAVKTGQSFRVKYLLRKLDVDVDHLFDDELTALHVAAWCGHLDCVKVLVEEGSDIEAVSSKYGTPLCVAVFRRHKDIVEALISTYNADVNAEGGWLGSPAHAACSTRNGRDCSIIDLLLDHGASLSESRTFNISFINHLDSRYPSSPAKLEVGITCQPLHIASCKSSTKITKRLLMAGADINSSATKPNEACGNVTPLILTCASGKAQMCEVLLSKGAHMESRDSSGSTAFMWAARSGSRECISALASRGVSIDAADQEGLTALMEAAIRGHIECFRFLVNTGADIKASDAKGITAVRYACLNGHSKTVVENTADALSLCGDKVACTTDKSTKSREIMRAVKDLENVCRRMRNAAKYIDQIQRAQDPNEFNNDPEWILNELVQHTESCNTTIYSFLSTAGYGTLISPTVKAIDRYVRAFKQFESMKFREKRGKAKNQAELHNKR